MKRSQAVLVFTLSLLTVSALWAAPKAKKANAEATQALLAAAVEADDDAILKALADGADPLVKDENGNTVLMLVAMGNYFGNEHVPIFDALLKAKVPIDAKNKDGQTALMLAAREGQDDNVDWLIEHGAKVNERSAVGWTPLMLAAYNGQNFAVNSLLRADADVKVKDADGWDALMLALSEGRGGVAGKLIEAGAVIPTGLVNGISPLIHTAFGGDLASVRLVLAKKPDLTARDQDGWSALEIAAYNGNAQIAMELLRAGIDPALKDKEGKTALDRAKEHENSEIAALLGAPWDRPKTGGTKIVLPCPVLGGDVQAAFEVRDEALVVTTTFPKPLTYYLGGGHTNRADSAVKYTYDGSVAPAYHFDTDGNRKTGRKADPLEKGVEGSEYSLDYMEYGTSVMLTYRNSDDEEVSKQVYENVLSADLTKLGEPLDASVSGDLSLEAANNNGVLETKIPLSVLGLAKGAKVRLVATVGACGPKEATVKM
ncbi:MAG TPA: ankyrin repeat domain-containing protein [Thermoanaerobaculia bacterium]|nr:ankyrin repeat domain-containing protein [Thermoanaerobaculia bacterium]